MLAQVMRLHSSRRQSNDELQTVSVVAGCYFGKYGDFSLLRPVVIAVLSSLCPVE